MPRDASPIEVHSRRDSVESFGPKQAVPSNILIDTVVKTAACCIAA
jgi:hypothetical protein